MNVFISYSHRDKEVTHKILERLRKAGIEPWIDEELIMPGQSWVQGLHSAISNSDALIVVLSNATSDSKWQVSEIAQLLAEQQKNPTKPLIPVMVTKGAEPPFFLKDRLYADLSDDKKFEQNIEKVIAALKGPPIPLLSDAEVETLKLREILAQKRLLVNDAKALEKNRLVSASTILATMASIVFLSTSILGIYFSKSTFDLGFLAPFGSFALGIVFGVLSSMMGNFAFRWFQNRSARKEDSHDD